MNLLTVFFGCFFNNKEMTCGKKYYRCVAKNPPQIMQYWRSSQNWAYHTKLSRQITALQTNGKYVNLIQRITVRHQNLH